MTCIRSMALLLVAFLSASNAFASDASSAAAMLAGDQVQRLDRAIAYYTEIRDQGGWQPVPDGPVLIAGMRHPDVRALRQRLRATGDYHAWMGADPLLFDVQLTQALMHFQYRHGLATDGVVDSLTRMILNTPVAQWLAQLEHARMEWANLPGGYLPRRVWVNIPEATVVALDSGRVEFSLRAIVGHPDRPTPVLSSYIRKVIINPSWTVPVSIAVKDLLPRQQADADYLARHQIRIFSGWSADAAELDADEIRWDQLNANNFPYRLRQDPGPHNSLGRVKFVFPNEHDVYIHDTPLPELLNLSFRSLSSGCIRVADPDALAHWLVGGSQQARLAKLQTQSSYQTHAVSLREAVPVDLVYLTAWVAPHDDSVQFRSDIYQLSRHATHIPRLAETR